MHTDHRKSIESIKRTEYFADMLEVTGFLKELRDKNPEDEKGTEMRYKQLSDLALYVNNLHSDADSFERVLQIVREDRVRAVTQLREIRAKQLMMITLLNNESLA